MVLVEDFYNNYPDSNEGIELNVPEYDCHYLDITILFYLDDSHDRKIHQYILMLCLVLFVTVQYYGTEKPT